MRFSCLDGFVAKQFANFLQLSGFPPFDLRSVSQLELAVGDNSRPER